MNRMQDAYQRLAFGLVSGLVLSLTSLSVRAQDSLNVEEESRFSWYAGVTTEVQWNMKNQHAGWFNYIEAGIGAGLWKGAEVNLDAIATYEYNRRVVEDIMYFSNIEIGENKAFRLIQAGITQKIGEKGLAFVGLRNMDFDYFTSPYSAFFTGSSNASLPVISYNFIAPTAPNSALAAHLEYNPIPQLTIKETVYNGVADDRLDRQFRFRPRKDGIMSYTSVNYAHNEHSLYSVGATLGNACIEGEEGMIRPFQYSLWTVAEQKLFSWKESHLGLLLQGGIAPKEESYCKNYWGAGLVADNLGKTGATIGLVINRGVFADGHETDLELSAGIPIGEYISIQPALHCINTSENYTMAGILRASVELGN